MKYKTFFILIFTLSLVLSGCASLRHAKHEDEPQTMAESEENSESKSGSKASSRSGAHESQTESMRKTIDESQPQKERPRGFQYGGMSSEAREIEDHLYGM